MVIVHWLIKDGKWDRYEGSLFEILSRCILNLYSRLILLIRCAFVPGNSVKHIKASKSFISHASSLPVTISSTLKYS